MRPFFPILDLYWLNKAILLYKYQKLKKSLKNSNKGYYVYI